MEEHFVIDSSIVMSWCFKDETNSYADGVLDRLNTATALVPSIWPLEVINVLLVAERKKRITPAASVQFLTLLAELPIFVQHEAPQQVMNDLLSLGRTTGLSSYDASYLALAMQKGIPLATLDNMLIAAAKDVGVKLLTC